jgi:hypothetical protein
MLSAPASPFASVRPGVSPVGGAQSIVTLDKTVMEANGIEVTTVTVQAMEPTESGDLVPMEGVAANAVVITVTGGSGNVVTQPASATDEDGTTTGSFTTTSAGTKTVSVVVLGNHLDSRPTCDADGEIIPPAPGDPFFEDDFTGPAFHPANGFTWDTSDQVTAVNFDGRDCARVAYLTPGGSGTLPFNMGQQLAEGWVQWDIYVGDTFEHENTSPNNKKFFQFWRTTYSDVAGGTWRFGCEYTTNSGTTPNSNIRWMSSRYDSNSNDSSGMGMPDNGTPFIGGSGPIPKETWKQIRIHWKASTDRVTADGVLQMWIDGVLEWSQTDGKFNNFNASPADCWIQNGYFMGAANGGFPDNPTYFYIDAVKFYDTDPGW